MNGRGFEPHFETWSCLCSFFLDAVTFLSLLLLTSCLIQNINYNNPPCLQSLVQVSTASLSFQASLPSSSQPRSSAEPTMTSGESGSSLSHVSLAELTFSTPQALQRGKRDGSSCFTSHSSLPPSFASSFRFPLTPSSTA